MVQRGGNSSVVDGRELIKDKEVIGKHEDKVKAVSEYPVSDPTQTDSHLSHI